MYRLSFEVVGQQHLHLYSDADPRMYSDTNQVVPNSEIPDEHWHKVSRETDDPWSQYNTLRAWAAADAQFVRNVVLEKATSAPTWERVQ
ncbi:MAG TPA: hypothetical protein VKA83_22235 [Methylomirabilota bacterium]|nr:hypothetical protein [Methylomirabilota bacterium]